MTKQEFQDMYDNLSHAEKQLFALSIKDKVIGKLRIIPENLPLIRYSKEELMAALTEDDVYSIIATRKELTDWLERQIMG